MLLIQFYLVIMYSSQPYLHGYPNLKMSTKFVVSNVKLCDRQPKAFFMNEYKFHSFPNTALYYTPRMFAIELAQTADM